MRYPITILLFTVLLVTLADCSSKQKPDLEGFNSDLWKKDRRGCEGKRVVLVEALLAKSVELKGMDDDEVTEFLGNPEKSNVEERGKRTYYYYIQPGSQCNSELLLEGSKLAVEFDALGRVKMVTEQNF